MKPLRTGNLPMFLRYGPGAGLAMIWKWFYYAPNTMKGMCERKSAARRTARVREPFKTGEPSTVATAPRARRRVIRRSLRDGEVLVAVRHVPVRGASRHRLRRRRRLPGAGVLLTSILADVITNVHSFIIIATNHVGDDIYRFETEQAPLGRLLPRRRLRLRQLQDGPTSTISSTAQLPDRAHMFGHLHEAVQIAQPKIKAICEKHGVPYVQESVWKRLVQLADVMVGKRSMLVWERGD